MTKATLKELLTPRQFQLIGLVSQGFSDRAIAEDLGISVGTVRLTINMALERMETSKRILLAARYVVEKDRGYYEGT